jgi:hypothetical protein
MKKYGKTNVTPTAGSSSVPSGVRVDVNGMGTTAHLVKDSNQIKGAAK